MNRAGGLPLDESGNANSSDKDSAADRWENGKLLAGNPESLRQIVLEEAKYLERLSRRLEALIESQTELSRRIGIYIHALGILPAIGRGIAAGFGVFLGATLVAGLFVVFLSRWEAVPIVGEFVKRILEYIQTKP
ncbi:MAG: hypothetical protein B1H03_02395 [Planctomycetales bacterium 4484_113]|nr:MAG: hypothetical protein B1H03_02395 [Planctomycetales bacterium 4484_113]